MYNLLLKKKILLCLLILSLFLFASVVYVGVNVQQLFRKSSADNADINSQLYMNKSIEPLIYECCTLRNSALRTKLFFLKTHKTAGSTVQNVILRSALRHSLDVLTVFYQSYYLPLTDLSILPEVITPNNKYDIFASHIRYDYERLRSYQYPNTLMVTLMRHPAKLFQSIYEYFDVKYSLGMTFPQFLNAPVKPPFFLTTTSWLAYRGYNQMSFDLGFDLIRNGKNQTAIDEFIEKIDREFDFVMITEHLEASLVLLANLMGWPLEYMAHLPINKTPRNPNDTYKLTSRDEFILMDLNPVDTQLYHHFLNKFLKCVKQYGEEKLQQQVIQLKMMNAQLMERCVAKLTRGIILNAIEYVPKNASDLECKYALCNQIEIEFSCVGEQSKRLRQLVTKELYG